MEIEDIKPGLKFSVDTDRIVDQSAVSRMRNFPKRSWFVSSDDEGAYVEGSILMLPADKEGIGPLKSNVKNLVAIPDSMFIALVDSGVFKIIKESNG